MSKNQSSFPDQLAKIATLVPKAPYDPRTAGQNLPLLTDIGKDGKDHLNIWEFAKTKMGRALNPLCDMPFVHSEHGRFHSIEGFYNWIRSTNRDDSLRALAGYPARISIKNIRIRQIENIRQIYGDAVWQKIQAWGKLGEELRESEMPIDFYYMPDRGAELRIRPMEATWVIPMFEEIRMALKDSREPNFDFLSDEHQKINKFKEARPRTRFGYSADLRDAYRTDQPGKKEHRRESKPAGKQRPALEASQKARKDMNIVEPREKRRDKAPQVKKEAPVFTGQINVNTGTPPEDLSTDLATGAVVQPVHHDGIAAEVALPIALLDQNCEPGNGAVLINNSGNEPVQAVVVENDGQVDNSAVLPGGAVLVDNASTVDNGHVEEEQSASAEEGLPNGGKPVTTV